MLFIICFRAGFFESLAVEAKVNAEKSVILRNAVHARKVMARRVQSMQYESMRKQRETSEFGVFSYFS